MWTTSEIAYLDTHANEGREAIAKRLGKTPNAVATMAHRRGISLRQQYFCPRCGAWSSRPLNAKTGWCVCCMKEIKVEEYKRAIDNARKEADRIARADHERQKFYSKKYRDLKEMTFKCNNDL